jgi:hypothetical protein
MTFLKPGTVVIVRFTVKFIYVPHEPNIPPIPKSNSSFPSITNFFRQILYDDTYSSVT